MAQLIGRTYGGTPFNYGGGGEEINVVFRTDPDILRAALPPVLQPLGSQSLAVVRLAQPSGHFGPYRGAYIGAPALLGDQPVFHMFTGIKTSFSGTVAGRDVWGMPLQTGDITMDWVEDILKIRVGRHGVEFVQLAVRLEKNLGTSPAPSDTPMLTLGTFATRRRTFENGPVKNVLVGLDKVKQNEALHNSDDSTGETNYWEASSVLKLVNGEPGDDWSIFPVHQVTKTVYTVSYGSGGRHTLDQGDVLAEWDDPE